MSGRWIVFWIVAFVLVPVPAVIVFLALWALSSKSKTP